MRHVFAAVGIVWLAGCVRGAEGLVRERAASDFACADYALHVEEVGPDVYRASGCGQELIYACRPARARRHAHGEAAAPSEDEFSDAAQEAPMECARRLH
jgi:hypothetical protein